MNVYTVGDSHCISFKYSPLVKKEYWIGGWTMHRVGRNGIDFSHILCDPIGAGYTVEKVPSDGIVLATFGEIDIRNHIYREIQMGRYEDEIIITLVMTFIRSLVFNKDKYKYIAVESIPPTCPDIVDKKLPVLGSPYDRLRFTLKINNVLENELPKVGIYFLNIYHHYCNSDGFIRKEVSDGGVHINYTPEMDIEIQKMIDFFLLTPKE